MQMIELRKDLTDREAAYRLLSACYYQPSSAWSEADLFAQLAGVLKAISPEASAAALRMDEAWQGCDLENITVDYARLLVGPMALQAPPYGSVYLDGDKQVMGASTVAVLQFYREAGLDLDADFTEMPDHIAVELEFVSYLLQKAAASETGADLRSWIERCTNFLAGFLTPWCGQFCAALRSNSENPFYAALADCTELLTSQRLATVSA
jgi:TorA maturation chaperone TorD